MNVYFWLFLPLWLFAVFISLYLIPKLIVRKNLVGDCVVIKDDEKTTYSLEIDRDPADIETMKYVCFRVQRNTQDNPSL